MNQTDEVFTYMKTHGSIDNRRAVHELNIYRLGARIWDLKSLGVEVTSEMKYRYGVDGKIETKWKEYRLS